MADKKTKGSIPSPPLPPALLHPQNERFNGDSSPTISTSPSLSNGVGTCNGDSSKSKPPKITRAFSTGSMILKRSRKRKTSKSKKPDTTSTTSSSSSTSTTSTSTTSTTTTTTNNGIDHHQVTTNDSEAKLSGENNELSPWKLVGIGFVPKLQQRKLVPSIKPQLLPKPKPNMSMTENPVVDRELSPLLQSGSIPNPATSNGELSPLLEPIPNLDTSNGELSSLPESIPSHDSTYRDGSNSCHGINGIAYGEEMAKSRSKEIICNGFSSPSSNMTSISSPAHKIDRRYSPLPKTPPATPQGKISEGYRPLPKSPLQSDEEGDVQSSSLSNTSVDSSLQENLGNELLPKEKETVVESLESRADDVPSSAETQKKDILDASLSPDANTTSPLIQGEAQGVAGQDYTIGEIVTTYSYALPVRVRILQGYCSDNSELNISTDDIYNIHSIRQTQMVTAKDEDGVSHRISLDAPVKVGLIYSPSQNYSVSLNGYEFKTIFDVASMPVLPKLIAATQTVVTVDDKNSVTEGEIVFVRHIHRSVFKGKKGLKVFSLLTKSNKVLFDDCLGYFTTKPSLVRMSLPELLERLGDVFPSRVVIYPTTDEANSSDYFPGTLSRVATLMECKTKTYLVASDVSYLDDNALEEVNMIPVPMESSTSFDLPLEDDISKLEVAVMKWTYPEDRLDDHVYDDTIVVDHTNNDAAASPCSGVPQDDHTYINLQEKQQLQQQGGGGGGGGGVNAENVSEKESIFIEEDQEAGYDTVGIHLISKDDKIPSPRQRHSSNEDEDQSGKEPPAINHHEYSTVATNRSSSAKKPSKPPLPNQGYSLVTQHRPICNGVAALEGEGDEVKGEVDSRSLNTSQSSSDITKMQTMLEMLTSKMELIDSQLSSLSTPTPTAANSDTKPVKPVAMEQEELVVTDAKTTKEVNLEYINSLSIEQVCDLMEAMCLSQYSQKLVEEQISGEILLECDETVLEKEIGMASKIHRIRLMKIISGQHSARALLNKVKETTF